MDKTFISLLRCPNTGEELELVSPTLLRSKKSKREYIIKDEIMVLL